MDMGLKFVYEAGEAEITEKKSRFIGTALPVHSEEEAIDLIAARKKKYWDARHNCWAFVVGDRQQLQRCSDDGEPQGTAGRPILDVLLGADVHDTLIIVTRYFGGVLLGTGGLVRAYTRAASDALSASAVVVRQSGYLLTLAADYNSLGKIQYLLAQREISTMDARYTDEVELDVIVPEEKVTELESALTEGTAGRIRFAAKQEAVFAMLGKEPILWEDL